VIVRNAIAEDLPRYLPLAQAFHAASPMHGVIPFDVNGFSNFFLQAVQNSNLGVWLAEDDGVVIGITGALFYPMYFSPTSMVVQELWWWLTPESRGKGAGQAMYKTIESWAAAKGAVALFMIALEDERANKMANLYARKGFRPMERTYIREVA
jgi:GNAT superfamily N-acetyltransferase